MENDPPLIVFEAPYVLEALQKYTELGFRHLNGILQK
jgi:hypothetical protein